MKSICAHITDAYISCGKVVPLKAFSPLYIIRCVSFMKIRSLSLSLTHRWPPPSWPFDCLKNKHQLFLCGTNKVLTSHFAGYPFPTAPPVDPFAKIKVVDCGVTKGCIRLEKDTSFACSPSFLNRALVQLYSQRLLYPRCCGSTS